MIKTFYAKCTVLAIASAILALLLSARPLQVAAPGSEGFSRRYIRTI